ncbi:helix-turn-helix domain-containing protein [Pimelobacter simplex]|uniref:helix-turn-helix domain-containing protein n=1 Tax=Nocardioides simplex TaxID=2045 RepID=UPI00214FB8BC|nr:helix-turn-helix domain-containing protein [Pimelobacter simplex]UUW91423.1 helix-turn-helix domain-containing protein [Pimelobacter simplex]UUW95251.1 helix-turn-helix domain-containing protein [Pimelobacter simplex]
MASSPHLRELGEFLKVRRAQLTPAQVGLPEHGHTRRRVTGLRREEVAQLAAISTDYYLRIEQGRLAPSPPVLAALARELRLDADQTAYAEGLVAQAGRRAPVRRRAPRPQVHQHLVRLMDQLDGTPAMVFGPRLDILAWNDLAAALLLDFGQVPERERNYIRMVFTDPEMKAVYPDWEDVARTCVEVLRMEAGTHPADPVLTALVGELSIADEHFRRWWAEHRVAHQDFGSKRIAHPVVGELVLDWDTFRYAGAPDQQLVLWSAEPGTPSADRLRELARRV